MALETLKDRETIYGERVIIMDDLRAKHPEMFNEAGAMDYARFEKEIRPNYPIQIRHDKNSISFTIQNGPIKENGKNGCQVDSLIAAAHEIIEGLDKKYPCSENKHALAALRMAMFALEMRTDRRIRDGIEGTNNEKKKEE